jgi:hypothetical protein
MKRMLSLCGTAVVLLKRVEAWNDGSQKYAPGAKAVVVCAAPAPTTFVFTFTFNAPKAHLSAHNHSLTHTHI